MELKEYAVKIGMDTSSEIPFKMVEGFKVQLTEVSYGFQKLLTFVIVGNKKLDMKARRKIQRASGLGGMLIKSVGLVDNAVFCPISKKAKSEKVELKISKMIKVMKELESSDLNYCPFCGSDEELDGHRIVEGVLVNLHNQCANDFLEKAEDKLQAHENKKKYPVGFLYALIGAVVGSIPAAIALFVFNFISAWLFLITPLISFYFYRKSGAPKTKLAISVISGITIVLSQLLGVVYYLVLINEAGITFEELTTVYRSDFYGDLGMILFFSALGVLISWNIMYKKTSDSVRKRLSQFK